MVHSDSKDAVESRTVGLTKDPSSAEATTTITDTTAVSNAASTTGQSDGYWKGHSATCLHIYVSSHFTKFEAILPVYE